MEAGNKMIQGLISIVVPIYNGEAYLGRCVQSVQAQTHTMWELLLIDGGSTDRTLAFCKAWQGRDERIRVFHSEENRGVSHGRNTGIREAQGEYLFFVDADDWLQPDCLSRLYEEIRQEGVQIAGCGFERCSDGDWEEARKPLERPYGRKLIAGKDLLEQALPAGSAGRAFFQRRLYHRRRYAVSLGDGAGSGNDQLQRIPRLLLLL